MEESPREYGWVRVRRQRGEQIALALLIAIGGAFFIGSRGLEVGSLQAPGPGIYPMVIATALVVLAALSMLRSMGEVAPQITPIELGHRNSAVVAAALGAVALLLEPLGYLLTAAMLIAGLTWLFTRARWKLVLLYGVGLAATYHVVFVTVFKVHLPAGILSLP